MNHVKVIFHTGGVSNNNLFYFFICLYVKSHDFSRVANMYLIINRLLLHSQ